jgi:hypothetical protein
MLGHLSEGEQYGELTECRRVLRERIGVDAQSLAYPLGAAFTFSEVTKRVAAETGYRAAFSFYGGINRPGETERFDIRRVGVDGQSVWRFAAQTSFAAATSCYWP